MSPDPMPRYLPRLTSPEVAAIDKTRAFVVLPIGAIEQHGPHLPIWTDSLVLETLLARTLSLCGDRVEAWALPVLAYGKSTEHHQFPGTFALSADTLARVIRDLGQSAARSGFRKFVMLNGHGGQPQIIDYMARDLRQATGLTVFAVHPYGLGQPEGVSNPDEQGLGMHAGTSETSTILAIDETLVKREALAANIPRQTEGYKYLSFRHGQAAHVAWLVHDLSPTGVVGDPRAASAEKGEAILSHMAQRLAEVFAEIERFEI